MISGVLGMGRRMAESRMTDECKITRPGEKVFDEETGAYTTTTVTVYEGKCRIKHPSTIGREAEAGSQLVVMTHSEIHLPMDAVGVMPSDSVEVTACPTRPDQVGRTFKVTTPFDGSQTTALRYRVEVTDGNRS